MRFEELPPMERLAIEQALYSKLGEDVSTKNPDSLRSEADREVVENYRTMGAKSYDVHVNGQKVGTYSVRTSKERPQETKRRLVVSDPYALDAYAREHADEAMEYVHMMMDNFAVFMLETHGVLCDGCEMVEDTISARPSEVIGTTLRVDADKVADAIRGYLPTGIAHLLDGGDDE